MKTGSLIEVVCPGVIGRFFYFIASAMKKPQLQALLSAYPDFTLPGASEARGLSIRLLQRASDDPHLSTSHQAFQKICALKGRSGACVDPEELSLVVYEFKMNPFLPLTSVQTTNASEPRKLITTKAKPASKKAALPFGLKPQVRKRKARTSNTGQAKKQKPHAGSAASSTPSNVAELLGGPVTGSELNALGSESGSEHQSVGQVSSSSSSSSSEDSDSDGSAEENQLAPHVEEEKEELRKVSMQHREHVEATGQIFCPRGEPDARDGARVPPEPPKTTTSTFCNAHLGLMDVGFQVAARLATCRHCMTKIERKTVRFGYAWSRSKFHSWLHPGCVLNHLKQEQGDLGQALSFLQGKLQEQDLPPLIRDSISELVQGIRAEDVELTR